MRRWFAVTATALAVGFVADFALLGVLIWHLGVAWTLGLLLVKSVLGYLLVRRVGRRGWRQFRASLDAGRPPGREVTEAAVALAGAMLVLMAGFLGALLGAVALVAPVRRGATRVAERLVERRFSAAMAGTVFGPRRVRVDRIQPPAGPPSGARVVRDPGPGASASGPGGSPAAIEGEIIGPADRPHRQPG